MHVRVHGADVSEKKAFMCVYTEHACVIMGRAAGNGTREARLVVPCTLTRMRSVRPSVGHHLRYCPAIMHDAQMRKCTGQPGMGRGKHAWSLHARSRACSVRGPG